MKEFGSKKIETAAIKMFIFSKMSDLNPLGGPFRNDLHNLKLSPLALLGGSKSGIQNFH